MGCTSLNIEKDRVLTSPYKQQSLFTRRSRLSDITHCSESSKPVLVKAKDTYILVLIVYAFALVSPPYDWYLQIVNSKIIIIKNIGKTTTSCLP